MKIKDIPGYEGLYQISEDGTIINRLSGNVLRGNINSHGYIAVSLYKNGMRKTHKLHRLLAIAFIPNPNDYECVNHIDGNKLNNSLRNLEWCTKGQNNRHAREKLSLNFSEKPIVQLTLDGKVVAVWVNANAAATFLRGNAVCISNCCRGTAQSAYDYKWEYAGMDFSRGIREQQKLYIDREIARLSKLSEQLSTL